MKSNLQNGLLGCAFSAMTFVILSGNANAQYPFPEFATPDAVAAKPTGDEIDPTLVSTPRLVDVIPSSSDLSGTQPSPAEIRQARAQFRSQQRVERMERNLWAGYEPLRPNWNPVPMMSSRYPYRNTFVVPLYLYPR